MHLVRLAQVVSLLLVAACGADFTGGVTPDAGGGVDAGSGVDGSVADAGAEAAIDAPPSQDTCNKLGDVKACKVTATGADGVQTCTQQPDKSLVYSPCVATACDPSARPSPSEACVSAGEFLMGGLDGTNGTREGDTLPAHKVNVRHRFYIDRFEVTSEEFQKWWSASPRPQPTDGALVYVSGAGDVVRWAAPSGGLKPAGTDVGNGCVLTFGTDPAKVQGSISCVPFETALAYCLAQGKRLPTEAEWEYVATGQSAGTTFPWGNTAPDDSCTQTIDKPCNTRSNVWPAQKPAATGGNTPVAQGAVNNLAGNVAEWTLDFYPPGSCLSASICWPAGSLDPLGMKDNGLGRVVRGGSYLSDADQVRARARGYAPADVANAPNGGAFGFRCVRDER